RSRPCPARAMSWRTWGRHRPHPPTLRPRAVPRASAGGCPRWGSPPRAPREAIHSHSWVSSHLHSHSWAFSHLHFLLGRGAWVPGLKHLQVELLVKLHDVVRHAVGQQFGAHG